jgi:hypothetical protein
MATIGNTFLTLADVYKQTDENKDIADIIEILHQRLDLLEDAPAMECNMGARHLTTVRNGLPTPTWRKLYQGVQPGKGTTTQVTDTTGMMESWSETDAKLLRLSKNPGKLRMNDARAHLEGMAQECAEVILYGDIATQPEKFTGMAPRFDTPSAGNGKQLVNGGGAGGVNTSIWFVTWGENTCHLLYPEGTQAGIRRQDLGEETKEKADGSMYRVAREKFEWDVGLSVRDWRGVSRICNIDVSELGSDPTASGYAGADLIDKMIDAYYLLDNPNQPQGRTAIYTSRRVATFLHKQASNKKNVNLTLETVQGKPMVSFLGHPIRRMDALLETEAAISFA